MFQTNYYAIKKGHCYPVQQDKITEENESGADIYWTPNNFVDFGCRKKEDLKQITCFFCEIDEGLKKNQLEKLIRHRLTPSCLVETKRGYHIYWYLKQPIDCIDSPVERADWFRSILKNRICPAFGADTQAADACRLMRAAFMRYWKDGTGMFKTNIVFDTDYRYSVEEVLAAFPEIKRYEPKPVQKNQNAVRFDLNSGDFWTKANNIPVLVGLERLSGTDAVSGETYSFKKQGGILRVLCNGRNSNAWIDSNGKIGSTDGAGPGIPNWVYYYQKSWPRVADELKKHFPELEAK
jgi:hypothetical protein